MEQINAEDFKHEYNVVELEDLRRKELLMNSTPSTFAKNYRLFHELKHWDGYFSPILSEIEEYSGGMN